jgi:hypothetical protein
MIIRWGIVLLCVFCLCPPALAERTLVTEFDGTEWQSWTEAKKFHFLTGFLMATTHIVGRNEPSSAACARAGAFDELRRRLSVQGNKAQADKKSRRTPPPPVFSRDDMILWGHCRAAMIQEGLRDYAIYEITVDQLSQGMDVLYKDPKNTRIPVADAVYAVKRQIQGASQEEMSFILINLRGE